VKLTLPTYIMQHGILSIWVKSIIWAVKNIVLSIKSKKINRLFLSMLNLPCCTGHWALYYRLGGLHLNIEAHMRLYIVECYECAIFCGKNEIFDWVFLSFGRVRIAFNYWQHKITAMFSFHICTFLPLLLLFSLCDGFMFYHYIMTQKVSAILLWNTPLELGLTIYIKSKIAMYVGVYY